MQSSMESGAYTILTGINAEPAAPHVEPAVSLDRRGQFLPMFRKG